MVEQAARRIAEAIVAQAPTGWTRGVLVGAVGCGSASVAGDYFVPDIAPWGHAMCSPFAELACLAEALREARGWERVSVEIECQPSGEYRLIATTDTVTSLRGRDGGFLTVLDADHRPVQPGSVQEGSTATEAGDPQRAAARFRQYMERRAEILGQSEPMPAPVSAAALDAAERRIGRALPADLRALYLIADGDGIGHEHRYVLADYAWLPLESLVAAHAARREPVWYGWEMGWDRVVFDADPPETVRRCGGHPGWLPFAYGNYLAVDMAPARDGRPGQVICLGRDHADGPAYVADSITSLLGHHLEALEEGDYEPATGDDEDEDDEQHEVHLTLPEPHPVPGPRKIVGEIPDEVPPTLQAIHINDAVDLSRAHVLDLTVLADLRELRYLSLNRQQWAEPLDRKLVPPTLAAARLADDDALLDEALTWSTRLGLGDTSAFRAAGTLRTDSG